MSSRLHNKFHRHNHHTSPPSNNDPRYPDASFDPIASYTVPFNGPFVIQNPNLIAPTTPSTLHTPNIAIDVAGDIAATGNIYAAGQYFGDGSQLALGNNTSLIATVTGTPFVYGASNPVTSITSSISGTGNGATAQYSTVAGGSANKINGSGSFSFIAAGSSNQINVPNTFILGTNINASLPNYTYVNNLSSLGTIYATTIGASSVNAIHIGDGSLLNLSNNPLSATTTTLVNTVSTTLNASVTSLNATTTTLVNTVSANLVTLTNTTSGILVTLTNATSSNLVTITNTVSTNLVTLVNTVSTNLNAPITGLQSLSGNWQNVYSLVNTTSATTFNVKNLSATGVVFASGVGIGTTIPNQTLTVVGNISATGNVYGVVNSNIGTSIGYDVSATSGNFNYLNSFIPLFSGANFSDYFAANAKYEIIASVNFKATAAGAASFYFAISGDSNISYGSYIATFGSGISTSGPTYSAGQVNTLTNLLSTNAIQGSSTTAPGPYDSLLVTSYIKTGNTPVNMALIGKVTTTNYTGQIVAGSYRKITRLA